MKTLKNFTIAMCLLVASCAYSTKYGKCIGWLDKEDPELEYSVSVRNAFWSFIALETVVAPIVWGFGCAKCPTGLKRTERASCDLNDDEFYVDTSIRVCNSIGRVPY